MPFAVFAMVVLAGAVVSAATFSMTGSVRIGNPSAGNTNPGVDIPNAAHAGRLVEQGAGGAIQLASRALLLGDSAAITANGLFGPRTNLRTFPGFECCAQLTFISQTYNKAATFAAGAGAGTIDWCPKATGCLSYGTGLAGVTYPQLIKIRPLAAQFGGSLRLLRNVTGGVWFVKATVPVLSISFQDNAVGFPDTWTGGITNFRVVQDTNPPGLLYVGGSLTGTKPNITPNGATGTPPIKATGPVAALGTFVGTGTVDPNDAFGTGFKMTTGSVFVADATPSTANGAGFSATTIGYDNRTASGNGVIKLVGSSVVHGGTTGNNFFRQTRLYMNLPEPGASLGLAAGIFVLVGLARMRRKS